MRLPFYIISTERYLIPTREGLELGLPEEAVRQWCAFELIREYGVSVCDLEFEAKVQIGSKPKRIDILVRRHEKPWLVVECKALRYKQSTKALTQAESYATASSIQAEFVLYTDGRDWVVKRYVFNNWIPVFDLPRQHDLISPTEITTELLYSIDVIKPLLAQIETHAKGEQAREYLDSLQVFFNGKNFFTHRVNHELREVLDMTLRVISTRKDVSDEQYACQKLRGAIGALNAFLASAQMNESARVGESDTSWQMLDTLFFTLSSLLESLGSVKNHDSLAARCALVFASYGRQQRRDEHFPETPYALHLAVRDFLELVLAVGLNAKLPDPIDSMGMKDLRGAAR